AEVQRAYTLLAEQKHRLEEAIGAIQEVHARVANGDLSARAPTQSGDPLLQLAVSLNLTLERLARTTTTAAHAEALEQELDLLSGHITELAQAHLHVPAPRVRRLAPLAYGLEQLRTGILQAIQQARSLVEQVDADTTSVGQLVQLLAPFEPADPEVIGALRHGGEAVHTAAAHPHGYLSRFL